MLKSTASGFVQDIRENLKIRHVNLGLDNKLISNNSNSESKISVHSSRAGEAGAAGMVRKGFRGRELPWREGTGLDRGREQAEDGREEWVSGPPCCHRRGLGGFELISVVFGSAWGA